MLTTTGCNSKFPEARGKGVHISVRIATNAGATPGAIDLHCPILRHDHPKHLKRFGKKGCRKRLTRIQQRPRSCGLVATTERYRSTDTALAKRQQRFQKQMSLRDDQKGLLNRRSKGFRLRGPLIGGPGDLRTSDANMSKRDGGQWRSMCGVL